MIRAFRLENKKTFAKWLERRLGIAKLDDWYAVSHAQIAASEGGAVLKGKSIYAFLKEVYPHHDWDKKKFESK
jgi:hypothetical protein